MRVKVMLAAISMMVAGCASAGTGSRSSSTTLPAAATSQSSTTAATITSLTSADTSASTLTPASGAPDTSAAAASTTPSIPSSDTAAPTPSQPDTATTEPAATPTATGWLTFDGNNDRRGVVAAGPDPTSITTRWKSPALDGIVYGQALVVDQTVFAATEGDSVYALSAADGHVLWNTNLGQPMRKSALPCGNIDPIGIISTPAIDPTGKVVYVVTFVQPGNHVLVALDTATGAVLWQHPIDPPGLSPLVEQQRSALTLANGRVYVAFGGLYGDCGPYKGAVVSLAADGTGDTASWVVPTQREGGIWAPAGPSIDPAGNLVLAIGNAASTNAANFDYGNSVVRLGPDLALADYWAPKNWPQLSAADKDLGSQSPVAIDASHLFVIGKSGVGYVLSAANLGKIGGQISQANLCSSEAFGGAATNGTIVVAGCDNGPAGASVSTDGVIAAAWHSSGGKSGAPLIVGNTVWLTGTNGHTRALDLTSGSVIADVQIAPALKGFPGTTITPTAVYVTGANTITALGNP